MRHPWKNRALSRRSALAGIGLAGGSAALTAGLPGSGGAGAQHPRAGGLPVLSTGDDWAEALAATPQVQLQPGATYTLNARAELPDDCFIAGNGATVTVAGDSSGALAVTGRSNVTITDVRFLGRAQSPVGTAASFGHVGVALTRSTNVRISNCDFTHWRGAGVTVQGSAADDYYAYRVKLDNNAFHGCYMGFSATDRSEYSMLTGNSFSYCRLAIWNSSGNWTVQGNNVVGCYGAYYSYPRTSPYGDLSSDNWNHGSLTGNTFNHANSGGKQRWDTGVAFPIGGVTQDPGTGIVVNGVLPPTFSGNTLWYSDVRAVDLRGTRWLLSGSTFSNLTIDCTGTVPVALAGTQSNGGAGAPALTGNVKDLFAALY